MGWSVKIRIKWTFLFLLIFRRWLNHMKTSMDTKMRVAVPFLLPPGLSREREARVPLVICSSSRTLMRSAVIRQKWARMTYRCGKQETLVKLSPFFRCAEIALKTVNHQWCSQRGLAHQEKWMAIDCTRSNWGLWLSPQTVPSTRPRWSFKIRTAIWSNNLRRKVHRYWSVNLPFPTSLLGKKQACQLSLRLKNWRAWRDRLSLAQWFRFTTSEQSNSQVFQRKRSNRIWVSRQLRWRIRWEIREYPIFSSRVRIKIRLTQLSSSQKHDWTVDLVHSKMTQYH